MIRHLPRLDPDRWYVIDVHQGDEDRPAWLERKVVLHGPDIEASASWALLRHSFGVGIQVGRHGDESDLGLDLYAGRLGSVWLRFRAPWTRWARVTKEQDPDRWYNPRHSGLRFWPWQGCIVALEVDKDAHQTSRADAWWHEMKLTTSTLLGRTKVDMIEGRSGVTQIPLPEGVYVGEWTERTMTVNYVGRRLGRIRDLVVGPRVHRYVDLKIEDGIPVEGKGEDAHNCGMDGLFGCGGATVEAAVGAAVSHVLRDRARYGGPHRLPWPMTVGEASLHNV